MKTDAKIEGYIVNGKSFVDEYSGEIYTGDKTFSEQLDALDGDITIEVNSPGGSFTAGGVMYAEITAYDKGKVTIVINGCAASAATFPCVAADKVIMSPVAIYAIHNPSRLAIGDHRVMESAKNNLLEAGAAMAEAYAKKTGKSIEAILQMMDAETTMNAKTAVENGFADEVMFEKQQIAAFWENTARAIAAASKRETAADTSKADAERVAIAERCADIMKNL